MSEDKTEVKYPECEKLNAVKEKSQACGELIAWLREEKKLTLCKFHEFEDDDDVDCEEDGHWLPAYHTIEGLLAEFFQIDMKKVEEERRAILEELRNKQ